MKNLILIIALLVAGGGVWYYLSTAEQVTLLAEGQQPAAPAPAAAESAQATIPKPGAPAPAKKETLLETVTGLVKSALPSNSGGGGEAPTSAPMPTTRDDCGIAEKTLGLASHREYTAAVGEINLSGPQVAVDMGVAYKRLEYLQTFPRETQIIVRKETYDATETAQLAAAIKRMSEKGTKRATIIVAAGKHLDAKEAKITLTEGELCRMRKMYALLLAHKPELFAADEADETDEAGAPKTN